MFVHSSFSLFAHHTLPDPFFFFEELIIFPVFRISLFFIIILFREDTERRCRRLNFVKCEIKAFNLFLYPSKKAPTYVKASFKNTRLHRPPPLKKKRKLCLMSQKINRTSTASTVCLTILGHMRLCNNVYTCIYLYIHTCIP